MWLLFIVPDLCAFAHAHKGVLDICKLQMTKGASPGCLGNMVGKTLKTRHTLVALHGVTLVALLALTREATQWQWTD